MSEHLRDNRDELNALIRRAATGLGVPVAYVEKDFWVTEVLRVASRKTRDPAAGRNRRVRVLHLQGWHQSQPRVFGLIDRFSEDVDLMAVYPEDTSPTARHKILKQVHTDVTAHLGLGPEDVSVDSSTTGVKRYTTYRYPADSTGSGIRDGVVLELGSRGGSYPTGKHAYRSMVAEHTIGEVGEAEDTWAELGAFTVNVLAPERTLLEKIAAVHDAATRSDEAALLKHGRHYYDIERLLRSPAVIGALEDLGPDGLDTLVEDINKHSAAAGFTWTERPAEGFAHSPAFDPDHASWAAVTAGYASAQDLIHGELVPLERVRTTVIESRHCL